MVQVLDKDYKDSWLHLFEHRQGQVVVSSDKKNLTFH
jgi:hypothetical protein